MFGSLRTYLALVVAAHHLLLIPLIGPYAVFSFFVLSGFLMTTIMHDSYGYSWAGRQRYVINRILRLYPSYWIAATVGLLVIIYCGENYIKHYKEALYFPRTMSQILSNMMMIFPNFFPTKVEPRLSPPTWAITIELFYYALICAGISKTRFVAIAWLAVSVIYVIATMVLGELHAYRFVSIAAGSLPFAIGSCLYFYKGYIGRILSSIKLFTTRNLVISHIMTYIVIVVVIHLTHIDALQEIGLYLSTAISALLLVRLYYLEAPAKIKKLDKLIGDYSYPIYLLHWQMGALSSFLLRRIAGHAYTPVAVFVLAMAMVLALATAIVFGLDPVIERLRTAVRRRASRQAAPDAMPARG